MASLRLLCTALLFCAAAEGRVSAQAEAARITAIEHYAAGDRIRIVVHLSTPVQYVEGTATDPYRVFFDLQGTSPDAQVNSKMPVDDPVLRRIRVAQYQPGVTRVVLDLERQQPYTATFIHKPPQLVIEVMRSAAVETISLPSPVAAPQVSAPIERRADVVSPGPQAAPAISRPTTATPVQPSSPVAAGASPSPSEAAAVSRLLAAVERGSADAQFQLGELYIQGRGGATRNPPEAARWFTRAAQQGHAQAAANLGVLYANGWGVNKSDADAVEWFRKAAEAGDPGGQNNLGAMYINGRGVQQDDTLGAKWVLRAAQQGIPEAEYTMGTLYANGRGVPRDDAQAVNWLQKSAAQGYASAQLALGKMYVSGTGVPRDYRQALKLFQDSNLPEGWFQMALLYQQGSGVPRSDAEAAVWLLKAAERGHSQAQYTIGRMYADRDPVEAYSWFAVAAASGDQRGVTAMNSLAQHLTPEQLAAAQKRAVDLAGRVKN